MLPYSKSIYRGRTKLFFVFTNVQAVINKHYCGPLQCHGASTLALLYNDLFTRV